MTCQPYVPLDSPKWWTTAHERYFRRWAAYLDRVEGNLDEMTQAPLSRAVREEATFPPQISVPEEAHVLDPPATPSLDKIEAIVSERGYAYQPADEGLASTASSTVYQASHDYRSSIVRAMLRLGTPRAAMRYALCASVGWLYRSERPIRGKRYHVTYNACRSRFCPGCAAARATRIRAGIVNVMASSSNPMMITLTLRGVPDRSLVDTLNTLQRSWVRMRKHSEFKSHVRGGVGVVEIKHTSQSWHCHLHVACDGRYWPQQRISDLWQTITGDSYIVDVRGMKTDHAASYLAKYLTKAHGEMADEHLTELVYALKGRRLYNDFGFVRAKGILKSCEEDTTDDELESTEENPVKCVASLYMLVVNKKLGRPGAEEVMREAWPYLARHMPRTPPPP